MSAGAPQSPRALGQPPRRLLITATTLLTGTVSPSWGGFRDNAGGWRRDFRVDLSVETQRAARRDRRCRQPSSSGRSCPRQPTAHLRHDNVDGHMRFCLRVYGRAVGGVAASDGFGHGRMGCMVRMSSRRSTETQGDCRLGNQFGRSRTNHMKAENLVVRFVRHDLDEPSVRRRSRPAEHPNGNVPTRTSKPRSLASRSVNPTLPISGSQ